MNPIHIRSMRSLTRAWLRRVACILLIALAGGPTSAAAQQPAATLFRGVRVFDGERVLERQDVLVEGGRITRVGRSLAAPAGAVTVDGAGKTLLPGLIDAHTHTFGEALQEAVVFGVTTHLDMFTDVATARTLRAEQAGGQARGRADLFSAGTLVTAPRGTAPSSASPSPP
ncbi:MAG TPA: hypothetical protein VFQ45_07795 [Longimicrobium sp.]|nr:hypothetical protein [Longimicrobium sp.]